MPVARTGGKGGCGSAAQTGVECGSGTAGVATGEIGKLEAFQEQAQPRLWWIDACKYCLSLFAVVAALGFWNLVAKSNAADEKLQQHGSALAKLEGELKALHQENRAQADQLLLVRSELRRLTGRPVIEGGQFDRGRVVRVLAQAITLRADDGTETTYALLPGVTVDGQQGRLGDVKTGMLVEIQTLVTQAGKRAVFWINTKPLPMPAPPKPAS